MAKVKVVVGSIEVSVDGVDFTRRQILALMDRAAALAAVMDFAEDTDKPASIGFTAHLERAPESLDQSLPYDDED